MSDLHDVAKSIIEGFIAQNLIDKGIDRHTAVYAAEKGFEYVKDQTADTESVLQAIAYARNYVTNQEAVNDVPK